MTSKKGSVQPEAILWLGAVRSCWFGWNSVGPISAKRGRILLTFGSFGSLGQKLQRNPCASRLRDLAAFFIEQKHSKNLPHLTKGNVSGLDSEFRLISRRAASDLYIVYCVLSLFTGILCIYSTVQISLSLRGCV